MEKISKITSPIERIKNKTFNRVDNRERKEPVPEPCNDCQQYGYECVCRFYK